MLIHSGRAAFEIVSPKMKCIGGAITTRDEIRAVNEKYDIFYRSCRSLDREFWIKCKFVWCGKRKYVSTAGYEFEVCLIPEGGKTPWFLTTAADDCYSLVLEEKA